MPKIPTVRVHSTSPGHEGGVIINESDFDPEVHDLFEAAAPRLNLGASDPSDEDEDD